VFGYLASGAAHVELTAGNPARAEEYARAGCGDLEARGLVRYLSSELCFLVDALILLGRLDEAGGQLDRAAPWAALDDVDALMRQDRSRARLELARGNVDAAERFARQAVAHIEAADAADEHAECLLVLAEVRRAAGDDGEAQSAAARALEVSEGRGHLVFAQQARKLLADPVPVN